MNALQFCTTFSQFGIRNCQLLFMSVLIRLEQETLLSSSYLINLSPNGAGGDVF